jgi:S1-C subfamily serine protease
MKKVILGIALVLVIAAVVQRFVQVSPEINSQLKSIFSQSPTPAKEEPYTILKKDSAERTEYEKTIVQVVNQSLPSVVTVGIKATTRTRGRIKFDPTNPFSPFQETPGEERTIEKNIGSGFIISDDGLIITNKHVVDFMDAEYNVLTNDGKEYTVDKIYRDSLNDLAILKINAKNLTPLPLGDSSKLQLGQTTIAIGTPLGEFRNTVTTGVISGLGRGITAGSPFEGYVEKLDNVIQTDASISPGNSGGPLLNSNGEVIGVNTAVSASGENIGFAIPSNVVRDLIETFNRRGGSFERPFIGVRYRIIDQRTAVVNDLPEGAYVLEVIEGSPAEKAGIRPEDVILSFNGKRIRGNDDTGLAELVLETNIGETVPVEIWREGETIRINLTLGSDQ